MGEIHIHITREGWKRSSERRAVLQLKNKVEVEVKVEGKTEVERVDAEGQMPSGK